MTYWRVFRDAVLKSDRQSVEKLTQFPFETRGELDEDPLQHYGKKAFPNIFKKALQEKVYAVSNESKTMQEMIRAHENITPKDVPAKGFARVENFEFRKIKGVWRFTRAYLSD